MRRILTMLSLAFYTIAELPLRLKRKKRRHRNKIKNKNLEEMVQSTLEYVESLEWDPAFPDETDSERNFNNAFARELVLECALLRYIEKNWQVLDRGCVHPIPRTLTYGGRYVFRIEGSETHEKL